MPELLIILIACIVGVSLIAFYDERIKQLLILIPQEVYHGRGIYRTITSGFIHADFWHLAINMYVLWSFGRAAEVYFSYAPMRMLQEMPSIHVGICFMMGVIVANLVTTQQYHKQANYASLGASGGVSAIVFATIAFQPFVPIYLFAAIPIPGILLGIGYLAFSFFASKKGGDNINHTAHIAGAVFGFIYPFVTSVDQVSRFLREISSLL